MGIKLTKERSGQCLISTYGNRLYIKCDRNSGEILFYPRYKKQVYDIIKSIRNNMERFDEHSRRDGIGRKYYFLQNLYRKIYPEKILRFSSNNILEEDLDDIIELLKGIEIDNKVRLNKKDLCNYNLLQLKTILASMKRRKKINGKKDNYFINLEV